MVNVEGRKSDRDRKRNKESCERERERDRGVRSDAFICSLPAPIKDPSMNLDIHLPQKLQLRKNLAARNRKKIVVIRFNPINVIALIKLHIYLTFHQELCFEKLPSF